MESRKTLIYTEKKKHNGLTIVEVQSISGKNSLKYEKNNSFCIMK